MTIKENTWVTKKKDKTIWSNLSGTWKQETNQEQIAACEQLIKVAKMKMSDEDRQMLINKNIDIYQSCMSEDEKKDNESINEQKKLTICDMLISFFKDFEFEPNFRFVNTLRHHCSSLDEAKDYICNYFKLTDNQYKEDVKEKVKSAEFKQMYDNLCSLNASTTAINHRLKIYFGSQGTGKTTDAMKESNNNVVVCHSAMLPSDLLEDFEFKDGKACFKKSLLWEAMEQGKAICLDEMNLLPFESLRFLQSILDNKKCICYKGKTIEIAEGFKIIGTMNLIVNGSIFNLPEPLVDRAYDLKEYRLTSKQLVGALN